MRILLPHILTAHDDNVVVIIYNYFPARQDKTIRVNNGLHIFIVEYWSNFDWDKPLKRIDQCCARKWN